MDRLKEAQLTYRASRRPVEYNYTNADIHHANTTPMDGYQFEYPVKWAGDPSTQKVIGLRRISYKPTSIDLAVNVAINTSDKGTVTVPLIYVFTDQNTFEECVNRITVDINTALEDAGSIVRCVSRYDKDRGDINIRMDDGMLFAKFSLSFDYGWDSLYDESDQQFRDGTNTHFKCEFLKLFNQEVTKEMVDKLHNNQIFQVDGSLYLENVWNRDSFYAHTSFSDSPKQIIGINNDFWYTPSVFYAPSDNSDDFNIYFTTDTVHRILPRNGVMLIQLSYIFNYQTSMLTYS